MPKLSVGQMAQRTIKFLTGLDNPRIASALYRYGFRNADRVQGYALLQRLTDDRLDELPPPPPDRRKVAQLDEWENEWFPVIRGSTRFRSPEVNEKLFRNLSQPQGPEVVISVGPLLRQNGFLGNGRRSTAGVDDVEDFDVDVSDSIAAPATVDGAEAGAAE